MKTALLSTRDLADPEVRRDCISELHRAQDLGGGAALLSWAEGWGEPLRLLLIANEDHFDAGFDPCG